MSALVDIRTAGRLLPVATGAPVGGLEATGVAFGQIVRDTERGREQLLMTEAWDAYLDEVATATGTRLPNPMLDLEDYEERYSREARAAFPGTMERQAEAQLLVYEDLRELAAKAPDAFPVLTWQGVAERYALPEEARLKEERGDVARRTTTMGDVGLFAGDMLGTMTEPAQMLTLLAAAPIAAETTLLRAIAIEGGLSGAAEAGTQAIAARERAGLGLETDAGAAAESVLLATVGGGLFGGAFKGLAMGMERLLGRHAELRPAPGPKETTARGALEAELASRQALGPLALPEVEARAAMAEADRIVATEGRPPVEGEVAGADTRLSARLLAPEMRDTELFVPGGGDRIWLARAPGDADFTTVPALSGYADADLPVRIPRRLLRHIDNPAHAEQAASYGFGGGLEMVERVLSGWEAAYPSNNAGRLLLAQPTDEIRSAVAVVELQRVRANAEPDHWEVVGSFITLDQKLGVPLVRRPQLPADRLVPVPSFIERLRLIDERNRRAASMEVPSGDKEIGTGAHDVKPAIGPTLRRVLMDEDLPEGGIGPVAAQTFGAELERLLGYMRGTAREPAEPMTLAAFVRAQGGIRVNTGTGTRTVGADDLLSRVGRGRLLSLTNDRKGLTLEQLAEAATEAGYFPGRRSGSQEDFARGDYGTGPASIDEMVEALAEDLAEGGRRRYAEGDAPVVAERATLEGLRREFAELGIDPRGMSDDEIAMRLTAAAMGFDELARGRYAGLPRTAEDIDREAAEIHAAGGLDDPDEQAIARAIEDDLVAALGDDPDALVPVGWDIDPQTGEQVVRTVTVEQLMAEIEADRTFVAEFNLCAGRAA
jgi:hypothetical protein